MVNKKKISIICVRIGQKNQSSPSASPMMPNGDPGVSLPLTVMMDDITLLRLYAAFQTDIQSPMSISV